MIYESLTRPDCSHLDRARGFWQRHLRQNKVLAGFQNSAGIRKYILTHLHWLGRKIWSGAEQFWAEMWQPQEQEMSSLTLDRSFLELPYNPISNFYKMGSSSFFTCCLEHWVCQAPRTNILMFFTQNLSPEEKLELTVITSTDFWKHNAYLFVQDSFGESKWFLAPPF